MAANAFACPKGHQWRDADDCSRCPICGAGAAETIGHRNWRHQSTEKRLVFGGLDALPGPNRQASVFGQSLELLVNKQKQDPLPPVEIAALVPQDLNDLCLD